MLHIELPSIEESIFLTIAYLPGIIHTLFYLYRRPWERTKQSSESIGSRAVLYTLFTLGALANAPFYTGYGHYFIYAPSRSLTVRACGLALSVCCALFLLYVHAHLAQNWSPVSKFLQAPSL
jgi:hypothetical protein